jgi:hypothetical protein
MRRIVEPGRIIYIERHLGWSLICFTSSVVLLVGTLGGRMGDPVGGLAALGAFFLFWRAMSLLFRKRAYVIRSKDHTLLIVDRWMKRKEETVIPLADVSVTLEQVVSTPNAKMPSWEHTESRLKLAIKGTDDIPFLSDIVGEEGSQLAHQLAKDLGCHVTLRQDRAP